MIIKWCTLVPSFTCRSANVSLYLSVWYGLEYLHGQHGGAVVSAVASQQEGPGFESRPFCVELACSPRVCVGFLRVLRFPPTSKDMHSILLSLPRDQGTGIITGVGPRALHCGCPLFLTSLGWAKRQRTNFPTGINKV